MSTTISPTLGAAVLYTQGGVGASSGYSAIDDRAVAYVAAVGTEGAFSFESAAGAVSERSAGANMSVDVDAGHLAVMGDSVSDQGIYIVRPHSGTINEIVASADPTDPRIDQVICEVLDATHDGGGSTLARIRIVAGTPTTGANLTNKSGAAALPSSALRLAYILVGAGATSIADASIEDARATTGGVLQSEVTADIATHAALRTGVHGRTTVLKTTNEVRNNQSDITQAYANDDELLYPVAASEVALIELTLLLQATSATPDWKIDFTGPASSAFTWGLMTTDEIAAGTWAVRPGSVATNPQALNSISSNLIFGSMNGTHGVVVRGIYAGGGTAGTLQLRWAQNTADPTNSTLKANSLLIAQRVL